MGILGGGTLLAVSLFLGIGCASADGLADNGPAATITTTDSQLVIGFVTFYTSCPPFCRITGDPAREGDMGCGYGFALGSTFEIIGEGRLHTCSHRRAGPEYWVDVYFDDADKGWAWLVNFGGTRPLLLRD